MPDAATATVGGAVPRPAAPDEPHCVEIDLSRVDPAVTEEDAGGPVLPVKHLGEHFTAYEEHLFRSARADVLVGYGKAVNEAGAARLEIERGGVNGADPVLDETGGRRYRLVHRDRRKKDEINFLRFHPGHFEGVLRGACGEIRERLVLGCDPSLAYAGSCAYPFVRSVDDLLEVEIGQYFFRKGPSRSYYSSLQFFHFRFPS